MNVFCLFRYDPDSDHGRLICIYDNYEAALLGKCFYEKNRKDLLVFYKIIDWPTRTTALS